MVSVRCGLEALVLAPVVFERLALLVLGGLTKGTFVFEIFSLEIEKEVLVDLASIFLVFGSLALGTVVEGLVDLVSFFLVFRGTVAEEWVDLALFILVLAGSSLLETVVEHESGFS